MRTIQVICAVLTFVCAAAAGQPELRADDDCESFVSRWNEWADTVDPDRSAINALQAAVDGAYESIRSVSSKYGGEAARWSLQDPFYHPDNWRLARKAYPLIAPHCDLVRARLAVPTLALRYKLPEVGVEFETDDRHPTSQAEVFWGTASEGSHAIRSAYSLLLIQTDFAKNLGHVGVVADNTIAVMHMARLQGEQPDVMSQFNVNGYTSAAAYDVKWLLMQPGVRDNGSLLERMQAGLLALYRLDRTWLRAVRFRQMVDKEELRESFSVDESSRLTARGRYAFSELFIDEQVNPLESAGRFQYLNGLPEDTVFAPVNEQVRVYRSIAEKLLVDLGRQRDGDAKHLGSADAFKEIIEGDDAIRFAPALSLFALDENYLMFEIRFEAERRAILTTLAIYRHYARHGDWPVLLESIDEDLLPIEPIDPYSGDVFGYDVRSGVPVLWSAGPDRDNDGGRREEASDDESWGRLRLRNLWFTPTEWAELEDVERDRYDGDIVHFPPTY